MTDIIKNEPSLWRECLPVIRPDADKYDRGVAVIYGAPKMTGATRLAARACARIGAGLVKVVAPAGTGNIYRSTLHEEIVTEDEEFREYPAADNIATYMSSHHHFTDPRCRAVLMGPGCPADVHYRDLFFRGIDAGHVRGLVLDAGAFTVWKGNFLEMQAFGDSDGVVLTLHEGEFKTVFETPDSGVTVPLTNDRAVSAELAARASNSTIVLKGPDTIISDGHGVIVHSRPLPQLATGGTGDVLAGMITGLITQGMEVKMASAAAVWIHAEAAARFGVGLVASDLSEMIPSILQDLR